VKKSAISVFIVASISAVSAQTSNVTVNVGADLRVRQEIMGNVPGTPGGGAQSPVVRNKSKNQMRFRMRAWGEMNFGDKFRIFSRVTDEPRWNITPQHSRASYENICQYAKSLWRFPYQSRLLDVSLSPIRNVGRLYSEA
jgi:hypothetical protein